MAKAASKKASAAIKSTRPTKTSAKLAAGKSAVKANARRQPKGNSKPANSKSSRPSNSAGAAKSAQTGRAPAAGVSRPSLVAQGPISAPVPTNDKPRKNQAGFTSRELEHFRDLLLAKRREIVGDMSSMEREALRSSGGSNLSTLPIHMADMGTDNYEQEFTLGLVETERKLLREINHALAKIQDGTYGICEGTGKPIGKARLEVQPWARYSIEYAKQMERGR